MILFMLLLILAWERLFKLSDFWQLDNYVERYLNKFNRATLSLATTVAMTILIMIVTIIVLYLFHFILYGFLTFLFSLFIAAGCIGAGIYRTYYRAYYLAIAAHDYNAENINYIRLSSIYSDGIILSHDTVVMDTSQNKILPFQLLWLNYRFYFAPLFWFLIGELFFYPYGVFLLVGYAVLRAFEYWMLSLGDEQLRQQSGISKIFYYVDWLPVRILGLFYLFIAQYKQWQPAWQAWKQIASRNDDSAYQLISLFSQQALPILANDGINLLDKITDSVRLAKKTVFSLVVIVLVISVVAFIF